jgi:hypothetical protein
MELESRPSSEQGLASAVNLAGAFDHEFTQTPLAKHASFSGSLVAEVDRGKDSDLCRIRHNQVMSDYGSCRIGLNRCAVSGSAAFQE